MLGSRRSPVPRMKTPVPGIAGCPCRALQPSAGHCRWIDRGPAPDAAVLGTLPPRTFVHRRVGEAALLMLITSQPLSLSDA